MAELVWLLDRSSGLIAYPALYLAVLTGIFYNTESFGVLHRASQRVHIELSVFAMIVTLFHAVLGILDSWFLVTGDGTDPIYSLSYFLGGVVVGMGALLLLVVAVIGFIGAKRFSRPWGPRIVHSFAYGGFAFAALHAAAIGSDMLGLIRPLIGPTIAFLIYVLLLRLLILKDIVTVASPD